MILLDITDSERQELFAILKRVADAMNVPESQKLVAVKVARQILGMP